MQFLGKNDNSAHAQSLCVCLLCAGAGKEDKWFFLLTICLYAVLNRYVSPSETLVNELYFTN